MQESKFNKLIQQLNEDMTVAGVLGATQVSQFSGDTYAPGDTRMPKILGMGSTKAPGKGKKKKKQFPIIRRSFPNGM